MGALSDPSVEELFSKHFVAAHAQVGDFEVTKIGNRLQKNGGNVASYFCTPSGQVIHSVVGPVDAMTLMEEAQWAIDNYKAIRDLPPVERMQAMSLAHLTALDPQQQMPSATDPLAHLRWVQRRGVDGKLKQIHDLLSKYPLAPLAQVYDEIFEKILGQKLSKAGRDMELAAAALKKAKEEKRPLLFVLHRGDSNDAWSHQWTNFVSERRPYRVQVKPLLEHYVVIVLPLKEMPALSQQLGRPPFDVKSGSPQFVVTRSDGEQITAASGWNYREILLALSEGIVTTVKDDPPNQKQLRQLARLIGKVDAGLADELKELIQADPSDKLAQLDTP